eukprot:scaffold6899_cov78-Skeletonema_dohrnii-CCMP3373.AAC.1
MGRGQFRAPRGVGCWQWCGEHPFLAAMATRPCMTSASRRRLTPSTSLPLENPRGSKNPSGATAPGRPKHGADSSGTQ